MIQETDNSIDVSIITVNYNSLDEIVNCYKSVLEHTSKSLNIELIVVSNSDEQEKEVEQFKSEFPDIKFIQLYENVGFSKANNIGFHQSSGEYIFFLNPDTILINDCIFNLRKFLKNNRDFGAIGPAVFSEDLSPVQSVNNFPTFLSLLSFVIPFGFLFIPDRFRYGNYSLNKTKEVEVIQGSSIFISSSLFRKVGFFNESYFMYSEETDLCKKIYNHGKKIGFVTAGKIIHIGGVTTRKNFIKLEVEKHRSRKKYLSIHNPNLVFVNRIFGSLGYLFRVIFATIFLRKEKLSHFSSLFKWYLTSYK